MNFTALIRGIQYHKIEQIPSLDGGDCVICQDENGMRFVCSAGLWDQCLEAAKPPAQKGITKRSAAAEKIALFRSLFRGRKDVFARRWQSVKTGQSGYSPVCKNEWAQGVCNKQQTPCARCPNRELVPLTDGEIYRHLAGKDEFARDVVGLYPMLPDESTCLLAVDFDGDGWQQDVTAFCQACEDVGLVPAVERSRSGNGGHVWFFFEAPVPAADARRLGSGLLTRAMEKRAEIQLRSYDRLFPNQDTLPKGGFGNLIALPLQGQARKSGNSVFVDEKFQPWPDQWAYLAGIEKIKTSHLEELLREVCRGGELGTLVETAEEQKPWIYPKPTTLTPMDFPERVKVTLADGIYVKKEGISQAARNRIRRLAAFRNPDFYKSQAMRLPTYNKPRIIDTSENLPEYLKLPRGCLDELLDILPAFDMEDARNSGRPIQVSFQGALREEQQPAAEALLAHDNGVLSATTAFGKTVVGAYLIGARKVNTLILVHSSALMNQWKAALEQFLLIGETIPEQPRKRGPKKKTGVIGLLGGGKHTIHGIVDIVMMQSLTSGDAVKELVRDYGMVLCDECHHVPAVSFERVLSATNAKYIYGLTATPLRADGHHPIIFLQCGPIRYRVDAKEQAKKRAFEHYIVPRFTQLRLPDAAELSIQEIYARVVKNESRNQFLVKDVREALTAGRSPLVLTERKDHAVLLVEQLAQACSNVFLLTGGDGQKAKREKLEQLKAVPPEEPVLVIATGKYIGEGFDEPRLDTLFLAMPIAWKGTLAQYAGRLHRNFDGKQEVQIYDYVDIHVKVLERMYQKRLRGYGELGYQVKPSAGTEQASIIFDSRSFLEPFAADLAEAEREVLLISPFMRNARVTAMLKLLASTMQNKVEVTVVTRPPEDYKPDQQPGIARLIDALQTEGITVVSRSGIHQKYAVIDQRIAW